MKAIRDWKSTNKTVNEPINFDGNPAYFTWSIRPLNEDEMVTVRQMTADERERRYEDAICQTQSIIHDYWIEDMTGEEVSKEIGEIWSQFGKRGQHDATKI